MILKIGLWAAFKKWLFQNVQNPEQPRPDHYCKDQEWRQKIWIDIGYTIVYPIEDIGTKNYQKKEKEFEVNSWKSISPQKSYDQKVNLETFEQKRTEILEIHHKLPQGFGEHPDLVLPPGDMPDEVG